MDPIDFLRRQGLGGRGSWVMGLVVGARAFQPRRHVRVTVRVYLIIQWGRASLGYMEESR